MDKAKNPVKLTVKAAIQIQRPAHEIFDAIINPGKMTKYFISYGSERMEEGKHLIWRFPEFDGDVPVRVGEMATDSALSFYWYAEGRETKVDIRLEPQAGSSTVVRITEGNMECDDAGIRWLVANTEGWANFLACMKAWLEYGVQLRKGAFDFMRG